MLKGTILAACVVVAFVVGLLWPHPGLTHCQEAVIEAQAQGLQGIEFNLYVGRDHGCVLDTSTGQWYTE